MLKNRDFVLAGVLVLALSAMSLVIPGCKSTPETSPPATGPEATTPGTVTTEPESKPDSSKPVAPELPVKETGRTTEALAALALPDEPLAEKRLNVVKVYSGGDEPGFCYLGGYAMLAKYADDSIEFSDVIAASGVGASAVYIDEINLLMNGYSIGSIGSAAVNQGFDYIIAALKGAQITDDFFAGNLTVDAREILSLENSDEAISLLKRVVSAGIPVMVHLDITFIKEAMIANTSYLKFAFAFAGSGHIDHYMTVTGYDEGFIYLNDPTEPEEDMGKDIPVNTNDFLDAWVNGNNPAIDESARIGPCWMIFLGERGLPKNAGELIAWNKDIAAEAPEAIRKAAERPNIVPLMHCSEMGRARQEFAAFLEENGYAEAGEIFTQISELFKVLDTSPDQRADLLRIADLQEEAAGKL